MNAITPFQTTNEDIQPRILDRDTISANRHKPNPDPDYIVQHFLFSGQVSIFAGPSNLGKSAIVASIAAHIAMGRDFCDMRVSRSAILYVAAEAPKGVLDRAYPFLHRDAAEAAAFEVLDLAVDLTDPSETRRLAEEAARFRDFHRCESLLIVFDTLSLCIGDGDENYTRDAARFDGKRWLSGKNNQRACPHRPSCRRR